MALGAALALMCQRAGLLGCGGMHGWGLVWSAGLGAPHAHAPACPPPALPTPPEPERRLGRPLACDGGGEGEQPPLHAHARLPVEDSVESYGGDLELSGGLALKAVHAAHGA